MRADYANRPDSIEPKKPGLLPPHRTGHKHEPKTQSKIQSAPSAHKPKSHQPQVAAQDAKHSGHKKANMGNQIAKGDQVIKKSHSRSQSRPSLGSIPGLENTFQEKLKNQRAQSAGQGAARGR